MPPKARNCDKADFATKVRKSSMNSQNANHKQLKRTCIEEEHQGTLRRHTWGGTFKSIPNKCEIATFTWFATKARMLPVKCASSDSYVPPPKGAVGVRLMDRAKHYTWLTQAFGTLFSSKTEGEDCRTSLCGSVTKSPVFIRACPYIRAFWQNRPYFARIFVILPVFLWFCAG